MRNITGKGLLGIVLMSAIGCDYATALETLDAIEAVAVRKGIFIDVIQDENEID